MKGNFHVRFLEGGGLATARLYSVKLSATRQVHVDGNGYCHEHVGLQATGLGRDQEQDQDQDQDQARGIGRQLALPR